MTNISCEHLNIPENIQLADPTFDVSSDIDLLIGADIFWDLLEQDKIRLPSGPFLLNTKLGWVVSGPIFSKHSDINQVQCNFYLYILRLFRYEHIRLLHASPLLLLANIRECWWPLGARNLAKKIVRECVTCTRHKGNTLSPIMGNLPNERLDPGFPFIRTGIDYIGPVYVLDRKDPHDFSPLTPAHFLIGRSLAAPACEDLTAATASQLTRYPRIEQLRQHFWKRWSKEYVVELQTRTKWKTNQSEIALDTLVLIKDDNLPPLKWKLGRVVKVFPGNDSVSRVADIRTANGIIRRSFAKICPLPLQSENPEDE
ncbi:hypothetical protein K1T71_008076 [Dendrolimus kikuchii]|uniref:Uncharacterized protein n=1 Tax=Dendrolimus kikuchii TaxID=765133 RepID=A0ACC1CXA6_9NEOP|nr:hypothetical protein K1T71_008076 [Dendrolimus kikuchii]